MRDQDKLSRSSLNQQAADKIREWILGLDLKPGERLIVDDLGDQLGVSRTPIRDGLRILIEEGFVKYDGRSYFVATHNREEIEDLFAVRRVLETLSARQAARRATKAEILSLELISEHYAANLGQNNLNVFIDYDLLFHQTIATASGNARLQLLLPRLNQQCWWISRILFGSLPGSYIGDPTVREHQLILAAVRERDVEKAEAAMRQHILAGEKRKLKNLETLEHTTGSLQI